MEVDNGRNTPKTYAHVEAAEFADHTVKRDKQTLLTCVWTQLSKGAKWMPRGKEKERVTKGKWICAVRLFFWTNDGSVAN